MCADLIIKISGKEKEKKTRVGFAKRVISTYIYFPSFSSNNTKLGRNKNETKTCDANKSLVAANSRDKSEEQNKKKMLKIFKNLASFHAEK